MLFRLKTLFFLLMFAYAEAAVSQESKVWILVRTRVPHNPDPIFNQILSHGALPFRFQTAYEKPLWIGGGGFAYEKLKIIGKANDSMSVQITIPNLFFSNRKKSWKDYPAADTMLTIHFKNGIRYYLIDAKIKNRFVNKSEVPEFSMKEIRKEHKGVKKVSRRKAFVSYNAIDDEIEIRYWNAVNDPN